MSEEPRTQEQQIVADGFWLRYVLQIFTYLKPASKRMLVQMLIEMLRYGRKGAKR